MNTLWFSYGVGGTAIVSQAEILGNKELHLKSGSDINLTCIVRQTPEPPTYIYWYHGSRVINYSQRGGKKLVSQRLLSSFSLLLDYLLHWDHYSMLIDHFLVSWNVTVEKAIFMFWGAVALTQFDSYGWNLQKCISMTIFGLFALNWTLTQFYWCFKQGEKLEVWYYH